MGGGGEVGPGGVIGKRSVSESVTLVKYFTLKHLSVWTMVSCGGVGEEG